MAADDPRSPCPCESGRRYADCCAPWHAGAAAPTAEALMRSRYSAFVLGLDDYLLATWHPDTRPSALELGTGEAVRWLGLRVLDRAEAGPDLAFVEFVARSKRGGGAATRLHERSRFVREQGRWYYCDGEFPARA